MLMRSDNVFVPLSVATLTDLYKVPLLPARLTLILIRAEEPVGIVHGTGGSSAVVQPHDGCTERIVTAEALTFVKLKLKRAKSWPALVSTACESVSHVMMPAGRDWLAWELFGLGGGLTALFIGWASADRLAKNKIIEQ